MFNIQNPEIVGSLGLEWNSTHRYNVNEVLFGIQNQLDYIAKIQTASEEDLTPFDHQIFQVYTNLIRYQELSFSLSCLLPLIKIDDIYYSTARLIANPLSLRLDNTPLRDVILTIELCNANKN